VVLWGTKGFEIFIVPIRLKFNLQNIWFRQEHVYWKAVTARGVGKNKRLAVRWETSREVMRKWVTNSWTRDPTRKHKHNLYTAKKKLHLFLCLLYRKQNTGCYTSSKCKLITQDKEEESAIISFWVISYVKMELASNILETDSISGIEVLCDKRQCRTTSSQPNCALRIQRFGCKMQGEASSTNPDDGHRNDLRKF